MSAIEPSFMRPVDLVFPVILHVENDIRSSFISDMGACSSNKESPHPNRPDFLSARREGDTVGRGHFNNSYFLLAVMLCYVSVP